jgi:glycosyltransferase involved in cell wall biosynthesis
MNKITLAIPFYNTSKYFLDCIRYSIDEDFVGEIVVNDDGSKEEEYLNLLNIIKKLNTDKIKVFKNQSNLGAFRNKYETVSKCSNEWIYLLDSDNYPFENTYNVIKSLDLSNLKIIYSPAKLYCKSDSQSTYSTISDYNTFKYDIIGIEESKDAIIKRTKWFDWLINTGNYVINKNFYLESLEEPFQNYSNYKLYADTAAAFYFILKNGGSFKIVSNLYHNHRLRDDSYWNQCGDESMATVNLYSNMILDL